MHQGAGLQIVTFLSVIFISVNFCKFNSETSKFCEQLANSQNRDFSMIKEIPRIFRFFLSMSFEGS